MQEMVMRSNGKHMTWEAVIGRFEPYLYLIDVSYQNVNEVSLNALFEVSTLVISFTQIYVVIHSEWHYAGVLTGPSQKPLVTLCL